MNIYQYDIYRVEQAENERKARDQEVIDHVQAENKFDQPTKRSLRRLLAWGHDLLMYLSQPVQARRSAFTIQRHKRHAHLKLRKIG